MSYEVGTKVRLYTGDEAFITDINKDEDTGEIIGYFVKFDPDEPDEEMVFDDEFEVIEED